MHWLAIAILGFMAGTLGGSLATYVCLRMFVRGLGEIIEEGSRRAQGR